MDTAGWAVSRRSITQVGRFSLSWILGQMSGGGLWRVLARGMRIQNIRQLPFGELDQDLRERIVRALDTILSCKLSLYKFHIRIYIFRKQCDYIWPNILFIHVVYVRTGYAFTVGSLYPKLSTLNVCNPARGQF